MVDFRVQQLPFGAGVEHLFCFVYALQILLFHSSSSSNLDSESPGPGSGPLDLAAPGPGLVTVSKCQLELELECARAGPCGTLAQLPSQRPGLQVDPASEPDGGTQKLASEPGGN
jgi:hypothetical protein